MATEAVLPINGSYNDSAQSVTLSNGGSDQSGSAASPPKDEVGWFFVEQYYTTMSRSPEKVHLFYNKRSQFVYGVEAEKVPVSVGQRAISERISELGIEDCKVRVTNVDSQESGKSIVLQVIGEMSVKKQPHRKFAQTFVLAEQPNGYFVLNDIFRYIADEPEDDELEPSPEPEAEEEEEEEEEEAEAEPQAAAAATADIKTLTSSDNLAEQAKTAEVVDKKLEQVTAAAVPNIDGPVVPEIPKVAPVPAAPSTSAEEEAEKPGEIEAIKPELPKDPEPTPAAVSPVAAPAAPAAPKEPAAPPKPAAPKTWARLVAGNKAPVPNLPVQQPGQAQAKTATSATAATPTGPAAAAAAAQPSASAPAAQHAAAAAAAAAAPSSTVSTSDATTEVPASPGGWQTAGQDNAKKQSRGQAAGNVNGYIKNVTATVEASALRQALSQYGELSYFDISRPKNCAFVEFKTAAGYNAAVAANPHKVNGEDIILEERRPRPATFGGNFRGGARGNRNSIDARTPSQGGRGGFNKDGGRGGFAPRGGRGGASGRGPRGAGQDA